MRLLQNAIYKSHTGNNASLCQTKLDYFELKCSFCYYAGQTELRLSHHNTTRAYLYEMHSDKKKR